MPSNPGTTVELVGLQHLGTGEGKTGQLVDYVSKEKILGDIQFRGAISDFYVLKQKILDADYDPLLIKINEDDIYGDGNNWQVVLGGEAAKTWAYIEEETARRQQLALDEKLREQIERMKPRSQKTRVVRPWVSKGSEAEIDEAAVAPRRQLLSVIVQRARRGFNGFTNLSDKDSTELWNSSQMECRPFKDPNFDLRRMEQDIAVQAVPPLCDAGVQAGSHRPRPQATQSVPLDLDDAAKLDVAKR